MRIPARAIAPVAAMLLISSLARAAGADVLTADHAVQIALQNSSQSVSARAGVLEARGGVQSAYSGVLPRVSASYSRSGSETDNSSGVTQLTSTLRFGSASFHDYRYSTTPALSGSWSVLNLSSLAGLSSAKTGLRASQQTLNATRDDVALATRQRFYDVVTAIRLEDVSGQALKLARDNERRVRALFDVGSVSRSDVLRAQVNTAQSQLDSLVKHQGVLTSRVNLAQQMGVAEGSLGQVDTVLAGGAHGDFDEAAVLAEARQNRPDIRAAELEVRSADQGVRAAKFLRLPYVTTTGFYDLQPSSDSKSLPDSSGIQLPATTGHNESDRSFGGTISVNLNVFDGLATSAQISSARARSLRAHDARDVLVRGLEGEVRSALLGYQTAVEGLNAASSALASATENLNLTQQKYNVGSATILDLIDAQVQLARARSDEVSAEAAIRVAEAVVDRVRGHQQ
jgi:outer membrane protein TolC